MAKKVIAQTAKGYGGPKRQVPKCGQHLRYKGISPPGTGCEVCWYIYRIRNGIKEELNAGTVDPEFIEAQT